MKSMGIVRKLDALGRIVLPKELRETFNLNDGDGLEVYTDANGEIILKKYAPGCVFCDNVDNLIELNGQHVCKDCAAEIAKKTK